MTAPAARTVPQAGVAGDVLQDHRQAGVLLVRARELSSGWATAGDRDQHVDGDDDDECAHDRAGQRLLRVAHLLARGGDGVEADEGEEDRAGRRRDAGGARVPEVVEVVAVEGGERR